MYISCSKCGKKSGTKDAQSWDTGCSHLVIDLVESFGKNGKLAPNLSVKGLSDFEHEEIISALKEKGFEVSITNNSLVTKKLPE